MPAPVPKTTAPSLNHRHPNYAEGYTAMFVELEFAGVAGLTSPTPTAVFVMVAESVGTATTPTVAEPPLGITPSAHPRTLLRWGLGSQVPWLGVAETNVMYDGKKSLTPTLWSTEPLVTVMVKVTG